MFGCSFSAQDLSAAQYDLFVRRQKQSAAIILLGDPYQVRVRFVASCEFGRLIFNCADAWAHNRVLMVSEVPAIQYLPAKRTLATALFL
jgi:hypothetical protein